MGFPETVSDGSEAPLGCPDSQSTSAFNPEPPSLQLPRKEKKRMYQTDKGNILEEAPKLPACSQDERSQYPECFFKMVF